MNYRIYSPLITATDSQYLAEMKANTTTYSKTWSTWGDTRVVLHRGRAGNTYYLRQRHWASPQHCSSSVDLSLAHIWGQSLNSMPFSTLRPWKQMISSIICNLMMISLPYPFFFFFKWRLLGVSQQSRALNILAKQLILEYITPLFIFFFLRMTLWIILASILKKNFI